MSQLIDPPRGGEFAGLEARLTAAGGQMQYPPTPPIARRVRERLEPRPGGRIALGGFARAALIALVIVIALMAVPGVRAAVLEFFRVGAVRIFPAPTATPTPAASGGAAPTPGIATPVPTSTLFEFPSGLFALDELEGETTLDDARARAGFPVLLPTYPEDLGPPDRVFLQYFGGYVVVMVWTEPGDPNRARLSLHALASGVNAFKNGAVMIEELQVRGRYAIWATGPYMLIYKDGDADMRRLIDGHVLVFIDGDVTYRLESSLSQEEAVKVAESLK